MKKKSPQKLSPAKSRKSPPAKSRKSPPTKSRKSSPAKSRKSSPAKSRKSPPPRSKKPSLDLLHRRLHQAEDALLNALNKNPKIFSPKIKSRPVRKEFDRDKWQEFYDNFDLNKAINGVRVDGKDLLFFRDSEEDVVVEKHYFEDRGRKIPVVKVKIRSKAEVEIFGSHLDGKSLDEITHVIYNKSNFELHTADQQSSSSPAFYDMLVKSKPNGWTASSAAGSKVKGAPAKTVFQGVSDEPDLEMILAEMEEIRNSSSDYYKSCPFFGADMAQMTLHRVGEKLIDFFVSAIRSLDFQKVTLIQKCMRYLESPPHTKSERFINSLLAACQSNKRLPSAVELLREMTRGGYQLKESRFYSDLPHVGLGWLTKK